MDWQTAGDIGGFVAFVIVVVIIGAAITKIKGKW